MGKECQVGRELRERLPRESKDEVGDWMLLMEEVGVKAEEDDLVDVAAAWVVLEVEAAADLAATAVGFDLAVVAPVWSCVLVFHEAG
ncbi:hypothetical protein ACLOJK_024411 [Asimina triloba]